MQAGRELSMPVVVLPRMIWIGTLRPCISSKAVRNFSDWIRAGSTIWKTWPGWASHDFSSDYWTFKVKDSIPRAQTEGWKPLREARACALVILLRQFTTIWRHRFTDFCVRSFAT